jgi:tripartite-type tricarboxylate transporter receptor subunit TctC
MEEKMKGFRGKASLLLVLVLIMMLVFSACTQPAAPTTAAPTTAAPTQGETTAAPTTAQTGLGDYPNKPVTLIVPWGAGGGADTTARVFASVAGAYLGQPLVPVLKPGAAGTVGHAEYLKEKPDGYTLIITANSPIVTVPSLREVPYDPLGDFKFIGRLTNLRNVVVVKATADYKNIDEFVAFAKANPGTITVGHSGAQGIGEMTVYLMELELGIDLIDVPFTTAGEAVIAAAGGHIDAASSSIAGAMVQIQEGNLIPIAMTSFDRDPFFPDVPTFLEMGYEIAIDNQIAIGTLKDTPQEIVDYLDEVIRQTLEDPSYITLAEGMGLTVDYLGPEDLLESIKTSINAVERVVESGLIELD